MSGEQSQPAPPTNETAKDRFFRVISDYLESEMQQRSVLAAPGRAPMPTAIPALADTYDNLDKEAKEAIDKFMEEINPDIEKKAAELLRNEIRDKIARTGDINKLMSAVKKGKKISLKRKKGCIFLQMGSGDPGDEIEEFMVAST